MYASFWVLRQRYALQEQLAKESEGGTIVSDSYEDISISKVAYPSTCLQLRHIAPLDDDMRVLMAQYFPDERPDRNPKHQTHQLGLPPRPRSLSLNPSLSGDWNDKRGGARPSEEVAYAMSISLYEENCDMDESVDSGIGKLNTQSHAGDPIADCCAVITTKNMVILVCADGCGWGKNAQLAARIAVLSMLKHVTDNIAQGVFTTEDIFKSLEKGLHKAQEDIIEAKAGLTTLCATVISQLLYPTNEKEWSVCSVRVGDTSAYLYCPETSEVKLLSHLPQQKMRDQRDCGGCLGPVVGDLPDLENITYSLTKVKNNVTVFLTSDGVSDNFNPTVTNHFKGTKCPHINNMYHKMYCSCGDSLTDSCDLDDIFEHFPLYVEKPDLDHHSALCSCHHTDPYQPEFCPVLIELLSNKYFNQAIQTYFISGTVREFVSSICRLLIQATEKKRTAMFRYKNRLKSLDSGEQFMINQIHRNYVRSLPGKLDHASIVAVSLSEFSALDSARRDSAKSDSSVIEKFLKCSMDFTTEHICSGVSKGSALNRPDSAYSSEGSSQAVGSAPSSLPNS